MVWLRKRFGTTWATTSLMDDFEKLFMGLKGPCEMLMIEQEHAPLISTVWIRLPSSAHAKIFPGFEQVSEVELPKSAILLAGHNSEFEKLFK